jgi:hypothetical protein
MAEPQRKDRSADEEHGGGYGADPFRRPVAAPPGGRISLGLGHAKLLFSAGSAGPWWTSNSPIVLVVLVRWCSQARLAARLR